MSCDRCGHPMTFLYDVIERETHFTLWDCGCGHKLLERRPARPGVAVRAAPVEVLARALEDDD